MPLSPGQLPKDAKIVELRPEHLDFDTRSEVPRGTRLAFELVMEGHPLPLDVQVNQCLVVDKDKKGYLYRARVLLSQLPAADRHLITLFIAKGRGAPELRGGP